MDTYKSVVTDTFSPERGYDALFTGSYPLEVSSTHIRLQALYWHSDFAQNALNPNFCKTCPSSVENLFTKDMRDSLSRWTKTHYLSLSKLHEQFREGGLPKDVRTYFESANQIAETHADFLKTHLKPELKKNVFIEDAIHLAPLSIALGKSLSQYVRSVPI